MNICYPKIYIFDWLDMTTLYNFFNLCFLRIWVTSSMINYVMLTLISEPNPDVPNLKYRKHNKQHIDLSVLVCFFCMLTPYTHMNYVLIKRVYKIYTITHFKRDIYYLCVHHLKKLFRVFNNTCMNQIIIFL